MTANAEGIGIAICRGCAVVLGMWLCADVVTFEQWLSPGSLASKVGNAPVRLAIGGCIAVDALLFAALWWGARRIGPTVMRPRDGPRDVAISAAFAFSSIYFLTVGADEVLRSTILRMIISTAADPGWGRLIPLLLFPRELSPWHGVPSVAVGACVALLSVYGVRALRWPEE